MSSWNRELLITPALSCCFSPAGVCPSVRPYGGSWHRCSARAAQDPTTMGLWGRWGRDPRLFPPLLQGQAPSSTWDAPGCVPWGAQVGVSGPPHTRSAPDRCPRGLGTSPIPMGSWWAPQRQLGELWGGSSGHEEFVHPGPTACAAPLLSLPPLQGGCAGGGCACHVCTGVCSCRGDGEVF